MQTQNTMEVPDEVKNALPPDPVPKPPTPAVAPPVVRTSVEIQNGIIAPKNIDEAFRWAVAIKNSGIAPKQFDTAEKILVGMQYAQELGLPGLTALRSMYIVNGTPALFGDLPLALVRKSGLLESFVEYQLDENGKVILAENNNLEAECHTAVCKVKRKGFKEIERTFTWKEVLRAGLDKNKWGEKETYKFYRKRMLQFRARTPALKDEFGDVLNGVAILEYDHFEDSRDVTQTEKPKSKLSQKLQEAANEPEA